MRDVRQRRRQRRGAPASPGRVAPTRRPAGTRRACCPPGPARGPPRGRLPDPGRRAAAAALRPWSGSAICPSAPATASRTRGSGSSILLSERAARPPRRRACPAPGPRRPGAHGSASAKRGFQRGVRRGPAPARPAPRPRASARTARRRPAPPPARRRPRAAQRIAAQRGRRVPPAHRLARPRGRRRRLLRVRPSAAHARHDGSDVETRRPARPQRASRPATSARGSSDVRMSGVMSRLCLSGR